MLAIPDGVAQAQFVITNKTRDNNLPELKVCVLTTVHAPNDNRIYYKQIRSLLDAGYQVSLIAQPTFGLFSFFDELKFLPLPKARSHLHRMTCLCWQALLKALAEKANVYHFHDPELIPVGLLLRLKGYRVIYDIHEDYETSIAQKSYFGRSYRKQVGLVAGCLERLSSRAFEIILAEKYYSKKHPRGVTVLNYPWKSQFKFLPITASTAMPKLIYTGSITEARGALIHVGILNIIEDAELYLVGQCSKELATKLYNLVSVNKRRLKIIGVNRYVPFDEIIGYYRHGYWTSALAIFPSDPHYSNKELTKLFEYMGAGIPIVCSNFTVWKDLVSEVGAGISVQPDDPEDIKSAVMSLFCSVELRIEMSNNGQAAIFEKYNWEKEAAKMIALYERIGVGVI